MPCGGIRIARKSVRRKKKKSGTGGRILLVLLAAAVAVTGYAYRGKIRNLVSDISAAQAAPPAASAAATGQPASASPEEPASREAAEEQAARPTPAPSPGAPPKAAPSAKPGPAAASETPEPAAETLAPKRETPTPAPETPTPGAAQPPDAETSAAEEAAARADGALSNTKYGWYFMKNSDHKPTRGASEIDISAFGARYLGDTGASAIYLTFDEGYENGYTPAILDTLKEKGVKAAFFLTQTFIRDNPDLVRRMAAEGHVCADHSVTHPSLPDCGDDKVIYEITEPARYFKEVTGLDMDPFFRPPNGEYSERTLSMTKDLGFTTVFWSYAYQDWVTDAQPGKQAAFDNVMNNLHPGEILLLHAVSQSNAEALPDIIDAVRAEGYEFRTLYELN